MDKTFLLYNPSCCVKYPKFWECLRFMVFEEDYNSYVKNYKNKFIPFEMCSKKLRSPSLRCNIKTNQFFNTPTIGPLGFLESIWCSFKNCEDYRFNVLVSDKSNFSSYNKETIRLAAFDMMSNSRWGLFHYLKIFMEFQDAFDRKSMQYYFFDCLIELALASSILYRNHEPKTKICRKIGYWDAYKSYFDVMQMCERKATLKFGVGNMKEFVQFMKDYPLEHYKDYIHRALETLGVDMPNCIDLIKNLTK